MTSQTRSIDADDQYFHDAAGGYACRLVKQFGRNRDVIMNEVNQIMDEELRKEVKWNLGYLLPKG